MAKGYVYILECCDGSYYTGSTKDLNNRVWEHENSKGANYTRSRLPVKLVYYEEYTRIDSAFNREKQIQGWSHNKKKALIEEKNIFYRNLLKRNLSELQWLRPRHDRKWRSLSHNLRKLAVIECSGMAMVFSLFKECIEMTGALNVYKDS